MCAVSEIMKFAFLFNCEKAINIFMLSCGILCCKNVYMSKIKDKYVLSFYK